VDRWNKTHCDKCKVEVDKGEGIYAEGGFIPLLRLQNSTNTKQYS